ncbi:MULTISPECIES: 3-oxoacyl-[acyl-carrier-protein] synthase III C-terminal domain-containing protein [unclassified Streptomyces]|uniref:3-oxoacyl-[acyl-carrier-protein] synthase III C-terminal domain-containing protein n=1 Tax=unclassified Streptomyces TaxID=2593676 RepID=UPI00336A7B2A
MRLGPVGTFVPHTALTVADVTAGAGLPDAKARFYRDYLGFRDVPRSAGHSLADMLTAAGREALRGTDPCDIRQVLYARIGEEAGPAGAGPAETEPAGAGLLDGVRTALGLDHAPAFAVGQMNCAAGLFALFLAGQVTGPEADGSALLLVGDRVARPERGVIPGIAVVADAAAACVVGPRVPGDPLLGSAFRTYGRFYRSLGGADPDREREYSRFYAPALAAVIQEALREAGTEPGGVRWIVPHNVNRLSWKGVAKELGIPFSQIFLDNLPRLGHANCADPYLNLASLRASGRLEPGDRYVMATVGLGATFGAVVLQREGGRGSEGGRDGEL